MLELVTLNYCAQWFNVHRYLRIDLYPPHSALSLQIVHLDVLIQVYIQEILIDFPS